MKPLKDFINHDPSIYKFRLPLTVLGKLRYNFLRFFLYRVPFLGNLHVNSRNESFYFEIIGSYFYKQFSFIPKLFTLNFNGFELGKYAQIFYPKDGWTLRSFGFDYKNIEMAKSKAYGEFLERHFSSSLDRNTEGQIRTYTYADLSNEIVLPNKFHNYSDNKKKSYFKTLPVRSLFTRVWHPCPIHLIYWAESGRKDLDFFYESTTSGCAGGFSKDEAVLGGLYELIERDSFLCYWLTQTKPKLLNIGNNEESLISGFTNLKNVLDKSNYSLYVLDITTNVGVPSVCCVVRNNLTNGICVSAASNLNKLVAIEKAILEAPMSMGIFNSEKDFVLPKDFVFLKDPRIRREERMLLWKNGRLSEKAKFLYEGESVGLQDWLQDVSVFKESGDDVPVQQQLERVKGVLGKMGDDYNKVYFFELKNKVLSQLGFNVVRVIAPKLLYLYMSESSAIRESKRLEDFMQWKNAIPSFSINIYPHPFP